MNNEQLIKLMEKDPVYFLETIFEKKLASTQKELLTTYFNRTIIVYSQNSRIKFFENNLISYGQDFSQHQSVPAIAFFVNSENEALITLVADGYGCGTKGTPPGEYGNGAIYVSKKELQHNLNSWIGINWCLKRGNENERRKR